MIQHTCLEHRFTKHIPDELEPGVLYVSMEYGTAVHSCCCGCGEEVVTPFSPTDWKMTFDGVTVSLSPSIGNWTLACRSHYVIRRGQVIEMASWTDKQIKEEHWRDRMVKAEYYRSSELSDSDLNKTPTKDLNGKTPSFLQRILKWISAQIFV